MRLCLMAHTKHDDWRYLVAALLFSFAISIGYIAASGVALATSEAVSEKVTKDTREDWVCREAAAIKRGTGYLVCGVGEHADEGTAREKARDSALREFHVLCRNSSDCRGHEVVLVPMRNQCDRLAGAVGSYSTTSALDRYKCFRGIRVDVLPTRDWDIRAHQESEQVDPQADFFDPLAPTMPKPIVQKASEKAVSPQEPRGMKREQEYGFMLRFACDKGDMESCHDYGSLVLDKGQRDEAISFFQKACQKGRWDIQAVACGRLEADFGIHMEPPKSNRGRLPASEPVIPVR